MILLTGFGKKSMKFCTNRTYGYRAKCYTIDKLKQMVDNQHGTAACMMAVSEQLRRK